MTEEPQQMIEPEFEAVVETGQISDVTESSVDGTVMRFESDLVQDNILQLYF